MATGYNSDFIPCAINKYLYAFLSLTHILFINLGTDNWWIICSPEELKIDSYYSDVYFFVKIL